MLQLQPSPDLTGNTNEGLRDRSLADDYWLNSAEVQGVRLIYISWALGVMRACCIHQLEIMCACCIHIHRLALLFALFFPSQLHYEGDLESVVSLNAIFVI